MAMLPSQFVTKNASPSSFACLFYHQYPRRRSTAGARRHSVPSVVTCSAGRGGSDAGDDHLRALERLERRGLMLSGLGGLAGLGLKGAAALATPIAPPDLSKCHSSSVADDDTNPTSTRTVECCPPFSPGAVDFQLPAKTATRTRPAAHQVQSDYIKKFEEAIRRMKNLPADDPRNFYQQANVHCAYCNDAYDQQVAGAHDKQLHIQVHSCWLFLPWHRMYLYFFERILGSLIDDENFAIPFWNWDDPSGMQMPAIYTRTSSTLYNPNRDKRHLPDSTIILDYSATDPDFPLDKERQIRENLATMHRTMITNGKTKELFMGDRFVLGDNPNPGAGSIELSPHNNVHVWSGNPTNTYYEDMGNFYSAARDCLFYAHHANVDRMWYLWNNKLNHTNYDDKDWLDAAFYFYDEKQQLVKVKVSDALSTERLGYTYDTRGNLPWMDPSARPRKTYDGAKVPAAESLAKFPLTLSSTVSTVVKRPKKSRSGNEKAAEEEVLVIKGIKLVPSIYAHFDVFVNAPETRGLTSSAAEFAGSFSNVPHKKKEGAKGIKPIGTSLRLALTELLKEIGAEDDDSIVVTLVPRKGEGKVTIGGVGIGYIKI